MSLSAMMSAVCFTNEAQPYSASHIDSGRVGKFWLTSLSWPAAFSIGLEKLVMRSSGV